MSDLVKDLEHWARVARHGLLDGPICEDRRVIISKLMKQAAATISQLEEINKGLQNNLSATQVALSIIERTPNAFEFTAELAKLTLQNQQLLEQLEKLQQLEIPYLET